MVLASPGPLLIPPPSSSPPKPPFRSYSATTPPRYGTCSGKRASGGMSGDHDRCFSILVLGAFLTGVFNTNALPRIIFGADVWGESSIMTGVY